MPPERDYLPMQSVLDWINSRTPSERRQLGIAGVVFALLAGLWFSNQQTQVVQSVPLPVPVELNTTIRVHIVGEVVAPGLYELNLGAIANDAIEKAGGFTSDAAQESINLARVLADGEQLIVLDKSAIVASGAPGKVSINRGTLADFDSLPGIGPALAGRIIEHRSSVGSFRSIEEITAVSGIGSKLFQQIKDQLTL